MNHTVKVFLLLIVFSQLLQAGMYGGIRGKVLENKTNNPLSGISVQLDDHRYNGASDSTGAYSIVFVPAGEYEISLIFKNDSIVEKQIIEIPPDQNITINFFLKKMYGRDNKADSSYQFIRLLQTPNAENVLSIEPGVQEIMFFEDRGTEKLHIQNHPALSAAYSLDGLQAVNPFLRHGFYHSELNDFAIDKIYIRNNVFDTEYAGNMSNLVSIASKRNNGSFETDFKIKLSNPGRLMVPHLLLGDKKAAYNFAVKPDYLRDNRELSAGVKGSIPFTNKRLKFLISGQTLKTAKRVYEFDNLIYNSADSSNSSNNIYLNKLDTTAGWRPMGFVDSWNLFSRLDWEITDRMYLGISSWNIESWYKVFNADNVSYQFYEPGLHLTKYIQRNQSINFYHNFSKKWLYEINLSYSEQDEHQGNTTDGNARSRFLKNDEYESNQTDIENSETNQYWYEYFVRGHEGLNRITKNRIIQGKAQIFAQFRKNHQIKTGFFYYRDINSQDQTSLPWLLTPYKQKYRIEHQNAAIFIQDFMEYDFLKIKAGFRTTAFHNDRTKSNWEPEFDPRIKLTKRVSDHLSFSMAYGKFTNYKNISYYEDIIQRLTRYQAGMNIVFGYGLSFYTEAWYNEYVNKRYLHYDKVNNYAPVVTGSSIITSVPFGKGMDINLKWTGRNNRILFQYTFSRLTEMRKLHWEGYQTADYTRTIPNREVVLPEDRTHDLFLMYTFSPGQTDKIKVFEFYPLNNTILTIISMAVSGFPYTPLKGDIPGKDLSKRSPWYYITNLSLTKRIDFSRAAISAGFIVRNLFDIKNAVEVWEQTGTAEQPGAELNELIERHIYSKTFFNMPQMYGRRREIDFILSVSF